MRSDGSTKGRLKGKADGSESADVMRIAAVLTILMSISVSTSFWVLLPGRATAERIPPPSSPASARRANSHPEAAPSQISSGAKAKADPAAALAEVEPSGIKAAQVGARAAATGYAVRSEEERLRGARADADLARSQFVPRLTATARYTRLSAFVPPVIFAGPPGVNQVFTTQSVGPPGSGIDPAQAFAQPAPSVTFPNVLDNYLLQATLVVPVSDYFLRIGQAYSAATHAVRAARLDALAARAKSAADGEIVYWTWLQARAAAGVTSLAVADQRLHLTDAKNQYAAGNASRVDVLRAETALIGAELQLERARNLAALGEKQVRVAVHAKEGERLVPGEGFEALPDDRWGSLVDLTREALDARLEIKSFDASAAAARDQVEVAGAIALPQLSAIADVIDANPNPRRIPQAAGWFPTWQVGVQLVWSPNDLLSPSRESTGASVRVAQLEALRAFVRDGVEVEVLRAFQDVHASDLARDVTVRQLASASEAQRVARQLYNAGRGTSILVVDAQTDLTRARLDNLNAAVECRIARVRLRHALGRDATAPQDPH
jgi:outer membrane protein TolC